MGLASKDSIRGYNSSGLRECSRFCVAKKLTCERPGAKVLAFPADAKQNQLGYIAKIESDTTAIRAAIFPILCQTRLLYRKPQASVPSALWQQCIPGTKYRWAGVFQHVLHRQRQNIVERHSRIAIEALMLRGHFSWSDFEIAKADQPTRCGISARQHAQENR